MRETYEDPLEQKFCQLFSVSLADSREQFKLTRKKIILRALSIENKKEIKVFGKTVFLKIFVAI
jgi:hypothetical protein